MKQRVLQELREAWNKLLHWELPTVDDLRPQQPGVRPAARHHSSTTLNLTAVGEEQHRRTASAVAVASSKLGTLGADVTRLCDRVLSRFVRRVTRDASTRVHVVDTRHARTASVSSATTPQAPPPVPDPSQVFDHLDQIFRFIGAALADVRVTDEETIPAGKIDAFWLGLLTSLWLSS